MSALLPGRESCQSPVAGRAVVAEVGGWLQCLSYSVLSVWVGFTIPDSRCDVPWR